MLEHRGLEASAVEALRIHLEEVINSSEFRMSRRSSEFLRHVVERAIAGDVDSLKERLLGIDIFHRPNDYDTSSDAIVRVTANDVRRRLTGYYNEHDLKFVKISLPLGTYVPEFAWTDRPLPDLSMPTHAQLVSPAPESLATVVSDSSAPLGTDVCGGESALDAPPVIRGEVRSSRRTRWIVAAVLIAGIISGLGAQALYTWVQMWMNQDRKMYSDLLGPIGLSGQEQTEIVLSNPRVLLYRGNQSPKRDPENELQSMAVPADLVPQLNQTANDTQGDFPFHFLVVDGMDYTGLGEAYGAVAVTSLLQRLNRSGHLTEARFLNWDAARQQQLVLLGAPHMSAFAQGTLATAHFAMDHDAVRNNHVGAGEQTSYARAVSGTKLTDYGLIWMAKSPSGSRVLVLAGLTSTGTQGVTSFFSDPKKMRQVWQRLHAEQKSRNFPDTWQALVRIEARENVPVNTTLITVGINDN